MATALLLIYRKLMASFLTACSLRMFGCIQGSRKHAVCPTDSRKITDRIIVSWHVTGLLSNCSSVEIPRWRRHGHPLLLIACQNPRWRVSLQNRRNPTSTRREELTEKLGGTRHRHGRGCNACRRQQRAENAERDCRGRGRGAALRAGRLPPCNARSRREWRSCRARDTPARREMTPAVQLAP